MGKQGGMSRQEERVYTKRLKEDKKFSTLCDNWTKRQYEESLSPTELAKLKLTQKMYAARAAQTPKEGAMEVPYEPKEVFLGAPTTEKVAELREKLNNKKPHIGDKSTQPAKTPSEKGKDKLPARIQMKQTGRVEI